MDNQEQILKVLERLTAEVALLRAEVRQRNIAEANRWTIADVCKFGRCSRTFVMSQLKSGKIPGATKEGRKWLFDPDDVRRFFGHITYQN